MKKIRFLFIPVLSLLLAGCDANEMIGKAGDTFNDAKDWVVSKTTNEEEKIDLNFADGKDISQVVKKGELGDFELVAPAQGAICNEQPTFTWTSSENAVTYTLEVCSHESFVSTTSSIVYAKETNISSTSCKLSSVLKQKNVTYYWRVTAINEYNSKSVGREKVSSIHSFFYQVESGGEVNIGVGEAEDWALHKGGSIANISIDHNDFFGTGEKDSLVISFDKEDTSQGTGVANSVGWIVVQRAIEQDIFGPDAFYCNFYYMGHDSTILIRVIDQDGELWYKQVKFTQDARQIALLKFDEFTLRTGDTVVQNEVFNYEHIQAIEVCFERTFGDGCCIIGGIKAVSFNDYVGMFINKLDFHILPEEEWINESYNFKKTISEDGSELKLEYSTEPGFNGNEKGMNNYGYGFAKIPVERYFGDGNAITVKVKYSGYLTDKINSIIRIYEPDRDRWSYTQPYMSLIADEFVELTIPFMAFEQSSINEGKRQFYYISQIQFGLNNCYGSGSLTYKDFEITTIPSVSSNPRVVGSDGLIENFDEYAYRGEAYKSWETSVENKDEGIFLENDSKFNDGVNKYAGKFTYKSDMSMASYDIYTDVQVENLNAVKFWIKDASVPNTTEPRFADYTGDDVAPLVVIQIALQDGRWYRYNIDKAPRKWTEYTIKFSDFYLYQGREYDTSDPVLSQYVVNFAFGMQYFYLYEGKGFPLYTQNNPVFMDNIMFTSAENSSEISLENELHPDENTLTLVDDMEYQNDAELNLHWFGTAEQDYENITLSNEVSSQGGNHSMKLDYRRGYDSPAYATYPTVGSDVESKGIILDIKGDGVATLYINLYIRAGNNTLHKYRATLTAVADSWNRYTIGFGTNIFVAQDGGGALGKTSMQNLQRITIGMSGGSSGETSSVYVDNVSFKLNGINYGDKIITPLA